MRKRGGMGEQSVRSESFLPTRCVVQHLGTWSLPSMWGMGMRT